MKKELREINGMPYEVTVADDGKTFIRNHDNFDMGKEIVLGTDWSTGSPREDKLEYYSEIEVEEECKTEI